MVTKQEIIEVLRDISLTFTVAGHNPASAVVESFAKRIESNGIEQPSIDALIAEAVATEREACALIGEAFDKKRPQSNYGRCIAEAIRARGQK